MQKHYYSAMIVLGIDPGVATVGIGVIDAHNPEQMRAIDWLTVETPANTPLADRLKEIVNDIEVLISKHAPVRIVVEKLFFSNNQKTAIDVAQARGAILATVAQKDVEILEPTPMELKAAICGDGGADKLQMQMMVQRLLQLEELPQPDDAADALGLAIYGAVHIELMSL